MLETPCADQRKRPKQGVSVLGTPCQKRLLTSDDAGKGVSGGFFSDPSVGRSSFNGLTGKYTCIRKGVWRNKPPQTPRCGGFPHLTRGDTEILVDQETPCHWTFPLVSTAGSRGDETP